MVLSPTEQRIYRHFYRSKIFSLDDCIKFLKNNYRAALVATKNMVDKKYAIKIRRGLYYIVPYEKTNKWFDSFSPNKFLIAQNLIEGFMSHQTALELYDVTEKKNSKVFICSKNKIPDVSAVDYDFYVIKTKHYFGYAKIDHDGSKVDVSDKERTIIDCLRNINYTSGVEDVLLSISKMEQVDFEKLFEYLKKINEVSLYSRVGFTMDRLKFNLKTPDWFRSKMTKKLNDRTYYLDMTKKGSSRHVREWKLMVPDIVFKLQV
jgi:predicted transcriptional regulator of viral defense system